MFVEGIDQITVLTVFDDIDRATILGGDNGQATCGCLDQSEAKWLGESGIDKDPPTERSKAIEQGDILWFVVFRIGDFAVEIVEINSEQDLFKYILSTAIHIEDIIPVTGNDD